MGTVHVKGDRLRTWWARILGAVSLSAVLVAAPSAAQATRPETVTRAILSVERGCPITPPLDDQQRPVEQRRLWPILGALVAGAAGNLVTSGINAIGSALESASQEAAFVAEGVGSFTAYRIDNGGKPTDMWRAVPDLRVEVLPDGASGTVPDGTPPQIAARCLVLAVPPKATAKGKPSGPQLSAASILSAFSATGIQQVRATNAEARLLGLGLTELPALYMEAEFVDASDGMLIQPVLVRYASPLPGAPEGTAATEMHVSLAVPGAPDTTDIGTLYALARMPLPMMAPGKSKDGVAGTVLSRAALQPYSSVVVPMRGTTGVVASTLSARNAIVTAIGTKKAEIAQLKEALRIAQRKLDQNRDASKTQELTNARDDATAALNAATADQAALTGRAKAEPLFAGSTNVKARFVVIRDANQFGLALAKALKAQAEGAGKAVTDRLTPKPEWTSQDTAYVEAVSAVRAAERAVDEAIAAGENSKVPGLQDAVIKAKAKANEAAVTSGRQPPYAILP